MRGWYKHSREHALAARGIQSRRVTGVAHGFTTVCGSQLVDRDNLVEFVKTSTNIPEQEGMSAEEFVDDMMGNLEEICSKKMTLLYRVVWAEKVNTDSPGTFYVARREHLHSAFTKDLYDMGRRWWEEREEGGAKSEGPVGETAIPPGVDYEKDAKVLAVWVPTEDIDLHQTVDGWFMHPWEQEIILEHDKRAKVVGITEGLP